MFEQVENFGKYALIERLAVGGMAEIFRATSRGMSGVDRMVAIKRIHRHLEQDDHLVQMLVDEARLTVRLQHPNVGQVFDLGCIDGQHFLVMEFISGVDLHRILRRVQQQQRHIPTAMVLYTMTEMLAGLHYAHDLCDDAGQSLGVVHRDISPQNIMFSMAGEVKLIDFGIAKARSQVMHTQAGIIKGKFYYMSPEQAHGQKLDRRCDVFAAGMVMYELVTGRPAYDEVGDVALLRKVRACDFEPPSHWRRDLDPNLELIIMKALHKDLRQRFQSAHEFREALQHYAKHHFPPMTRSETSSFVTRLLDPEQVKKSASADDVMLRADFSATDDSLIFDVAHMSRSMEGPAASRSAKPNNFADQLSPNENPFATADEPTYVYSLENENPFAIPDDLAAPAPIASSPSPRRKSSPKHRPAPQKNIRVSSSPQSKGGLPPRPPSRGLPPRPLSLSTASTNPAIVNDITMPRGSVDLKNLDLLGAYEPAHNPDYVVPISMSPPPGSLGPREMTQITRPAVDSLQYGFRSTGEVAAVDRAQVMGAVMTKESARPVPSVSASPLARLHRLKSSLDASPHRSKILVAAACALIFGIAFPFLLPGSEETTTDQTTEDATVLTQGDSKKPADTNTTPRLATLSINSTPPDAEVLIDGKLIGQTPRILNMLHVGDTPTLTLRRDGFKPWERQLRIDNPTPDPVSVILQPDMRDGVLRVETTPPGMTVSVDGRVEGKTPFILKDLDRQRSYEVVVMQSKDASSGKRSIVSWDIERDELERLISFDFAPAQGESDLPEASTPDKPRRKRPERKRPPTRKPDIKTAPLDVWGNAKDKPKKSTVDTSLDVWGNKKK